ncbi:NADP-dependent 3-hydroxy acid dehydrogenase YdfG [Homoserinimonas aerilata]|uniref:NADP-dependent 3-hydroxy acid dehydrogenase YdfG n=1 Tax=Homoserinimonas aerilata TaxID=1162970 RepID=A0A542YKC1_9MICO|nr:SDR family oxidoreductase [Homoserinimonas aerilata]TQL48549.1 NADP-dependent 3-hydroxy acid dehydrogenase YdfG [Homoserinimonas aerilata]
MSGAGTRRVVVTGASSGIGAATVRLFREHGWEVVGVARRADRLEALAAETGADIFVADLTLQSDVDALREHLQKLGPVHALVNNAGGAFGSATVEEAAVEDWQRMFEVNVIAVKRVVSALLPLLRAGIDEGDADAELPHADILTVSSTAGLTPYEGGGGYNAAKSGVHALVGALRLELAGEPIRVTEIAPGMVHTPEFTLNRLRGDQQKADAVYEGVTHPLVADDIARVIVQTLEMPGHVNLDLVVVRPVAQAAQHKLVRGELKPRA